MTPNDVLRLPPHATYAEVTAAYRALAQIFHPDRFLDCDEDVRRVAEARMVALNDAYAVLKRTGGARAKARSKWYESESSGDATGPVTTVPWELSAAQRAAQALRAQRKREEDERQADRGTAVEREKPRRPNPQVVAGLGEALHTNSFRCRGCRSLQWLPNGWKDRLSDSDFFCSACGRLLLAYRPREG